MKNTVLLLIKNINGNYKTIFSDFYCKLRWVIPQAIETHSHQDSS